MAAHSYNSTIFKAQLCMLIALHGSMDDDKNYIYIYTSIYISHESEFTKFSVVLRVGGVFLGSWHMGCFSVG